MDTILQDIRFAFRSLRRSPGLVLVATLSLALGIAVNVTIYAAVDILLLRPQPFEEPHRLVHLWSTNPSRGWEEASISLADFRDWRAQSRTTSLAAYRGANFNLSDDEESPERVNGSRVSPEFFSVLGARPAMGRVFSAEEEQPGREGVAVISDAFWRRRFDADPGHPQQDHPARWPDGHHHRRHAGGIYLPAECDWMSGPRWPRSRGRPATPATSASSAGSLPGPRSPRPGRRWRASPGDSPPRTPRRNAGMSAG